MKIASHLTVILALAAQCVASAVHTGEPHSTVQTLTNDNFDEVLNDPANGLWILKFYAPWCGHCKKMAPTLDKMAVYLSGKIAIGKIDCTVEKEICKVHGVRGYPTLKIFRDGDFFDYPGKRDADSMIDFAEKMSQPAVSLVSSHDEFKKNALEKSLTNVAFVAYDPETKAVSKKQGGDELELVEKYLASTTALQVFRQVARKLQDKATFAMLDPAARDELQKFGLKSHGSRKEGPVLVRIEEDVKPVVYRGELNSMDFLQFVNANNVALVTDLQGSNFRTVAYKGKPLMIGVVDPEDADKTREFTAVLKNTAKIYSAKEEGSKYQFATMDGKKWTNFLKQFSITPGALPQYLILDVPTRMYYQNETFADIYAFMQGVEDGTIEQREQETQSGNGPLEYVHSVFVKYMPYSLIGLVVVFGAMIYFALSENEDEIRYREEMALRQERARVASLQKKKKTVKED